MFIYEFPLSLVTSSLAGLPLYCCRPHNIPLAGLPLHCHVQYTDLPWLASLCTAMCNVQSSPWLAPLCFVLPCAMCRPHPGWPPFALYCHVQYAWNTELSPAGDPSLLTTSHYLWVSVHTAVYIHVLNTELDLTGDPSLLAASHSLCTHSLYVLHVWRGCEWAGHNRPSNQETVLLGPVSV